jgi:predicted nucleic acid-binding protein
VKGLTVDSSVIISSLLEQESRHKEALEIWQRVLAGKNFAVMPFSVLVEVVAAIRRRTGSEELAIEVKKALLGMEAVSFIVLDEQAAEDAAEIAAKTAVLLVTPQVRPWMSRMMRNIRNLTVLAYNEIPDDKRVQMVAAVG